MKIVQNHIVMALSQKQNRTAKTCWEDETRGLKGIVPGDSQWVEPEHMLNDSAVTACCRILDFKRAFG